MNKINTYLEEHSACILTLVREGSVWLAKISSPSNSRVVLGRGTLPSAALTELDRKLAMFAH